MNIWKLLHSILMVVAGAIFLEETMFGCIAVLGIGFDTKEDVCLDLALTMAFPLFLLAIRNRSLSLIALWIFYVARWIDLCMLSHPPILLNPLGDWHGVLLLSGILLFSGAQMIDCENEPTVETVKK